MSPTLAGLPILKRSPCRNAQVLRFGPPGPPWSADAGWAIASTPAISPATMNAPVNFRMTHFLCVVEYRTARPSRLPVFNNRSEEHTSELQSLTNLVCRLLLEKKKKDNTKKLW